MESWRLLVLLNRKGKESRNKQLKMVKRMMTRMMLILLVLRMHQKERKLMGTLRQMIML
jgi:hypothetical protein